MHRRNVNSSPDTCLAKPRYLEALELRQEGHTYAEIGKQLGCSAPRAFEIVRKCLSEYNTLLKENVAEIISCEVVRLDALQVAIWDKAASGDLRAIDSVLRIMERRARLLGLDASPRKEEVKEAPFIFNINFGATATN